MAFTWRDVQQPSFGDAIAARGGISNANQNAGRSAYLGSLMLDSAFNAAKTQVNEAEQQKLLALNATSSQDLMQKMRGMPMSQYADPTTVRDFANTLGTDLDAAHTNQLQERSRGNVELLDQMFLREQANDPDAFNEKLTTGGFLKEISAMEDAYPGMTSDYYKSRFGIKADEAEKLQAALQATKDASDEELRLTIGTNQDTFLKTGQPNVILNMETGNLDESYAKVPGAIASNEAAYNAVADTTTMSGLAFNAEKEVDEDQLPKFVAIARKWKDPNLFRLMVMSAIDKDDEGNFKEFQMDKLVRMDELFTKDYGRHVKKDPNYRNSLNKITAGLMAGDDADEIYRSVEAGRSDSGKSTGAAEGVLTPEEIEALPVEQREAAKLQSDIIQAQTKIDETGAGGLAWDTTKIGAKWLWEAWKSGQQFDEVPQPTSLLGLARISTAKSLERWKRGQQADVDAMSERLRQLQANTPAPAK